MTSEARPLIDLDHFLRPEAGRSAEMQALFEYLNSLDQNGPDLDSLPIEEVRAHRRRQSKIVHAELPAVESATRIEVPGLGQDPAVPCELIVPHDARPGCVVYAHGGGWAFGDLDTHTRLAHVLAVETKRRVLSVGYRLSPETAYPGPLDDMVAAWRWVVEQSTREAGFQGTLAVCGDSAGANLAVACMLRESEQGRRLPDLAMLFYGVFGDDTETPSYLRFGTGHGLARAGMVRFWDWYAPREAPGQPRQEPTIVPLRASEAMLAKLPPLYMIAAGLDPLLCDTAAMAERLRAAGVEVEAHAHPGVHHGFMQHTARLEEARKALAQMSDFFHRHAKA